MNKTRQASPVFRSLCGSFGTAAVLILVPAVLCAFKYAGEGLNADIVLNQVMSAQKLTLFYWGQNRLLNIVPFGLSLIKFPLLNLFCLLLIATGSFFTLLYLGAILANKLTFSDSGFKNVPLLYLLTICLCIALFTSHAWVSIALWHFEYTLSLIFLLAGSWPYYVRRSSFIWFFPCAFLALGINPALLVIAISVIGLKILARRRYNKQDLVFCGWVFLCFVFWRLAGGAQGSYSDYSTILLVNIQRGLQNLLTGLFSDTLRPGSMAMIVLGCLMAGLLCNHKDPISKNGNRGARHAVSICIIVLIAYSIFVASNRWVEMNEFAPRYLIPALFMGFFATQCVFARFLLLLNQRLTTAVFSLLLLPVCLFFWPSSFNLLNARIYRDCEQVVKPGEHFYAGDYWKSWACVSRDLNHGFFSQGLAYRSSSNHENAKLALEQKLATGSLLEVYCLGGEVEECKRDLAEHFPEFELELVEPRAGNAVLFIRGTGQSGMKKQGE